MTPDERRLIAFVREGGDVIRLSARDLRTLVLVEDRLRRHDGGRVRFSKRAFAKGVPNRV